MRKTVSCADQLQGRRFRRAAIAKTSAWALITTFVLQTATAAAQDAPEGAAQDAPQDAIELPTVEVTAEAPVETITPGTPSAGMGASTDMNEAASAFSGYQRSGQPARFLAARAKRSRSYRV